MLEDPVSSLACGLLLYCITVTINLTTALNTDRYMLQDYYRAVAADVHEGGGMGGGMGGPPMHGGYGMGQGMGGPGMYDPYGMPPQHGGGMGGGGGGGGGYGGGVPEGGTTILKLRGLPFQVQDEDIIRWFEDAPITPLTADRCVHSCFEADA